MLNLEYGQGEQVSMGVMTNLTRGPHCITIPKCEKKAKSARQLMDAQ